MAFNAAEDLLTRSRAAASGHKIAVIDENGAHTYDALYDRVDRCAQALLDLDLHAGDRIVLCLVDTVDFHAAFLGAIKAGITPIPLNTLLTADDYAYILNDSGARAVIVSAPLLSVVGEGARQGAWMGRVIVSGAGPGANDATLQERIATAARLQKAHDAQPSDPAFWLYSSGSTGRPKGTVHRHASLGHTADLFGIGVLGLRTDDVVYSVAKLFFAYGLGNSLSFPLSVGATVVLFSGRATPETASALLTQHPVTVFCGVPTFFGALLASPHLPPRDKLALRLCTSAGEALPEPVGRAWNERTGTEIVDGIGSTEMLHIFVSNKPGAVRYGVTGRPVPGYSVRIVDETGGDVAVGETGELLVSGPSAAALYWNQAEKTKATFTGDWVRTGDKFLCTEEGDYVFCGRVDDMLKVGGIWVSPAEVESAIMAHDAVLEAAVIGVRDESDLVKPKAFVACRPGATPGPELDAAIKAFVKSRLAPYKYPRWIEFVDALPKTATGKVQRFVLRARENARYGDAS